MFQGDSGQQVDQEEGSSRLRRVEPFPFDGQSWKLSGSGGLHRAA